MTRPMQWVFAGIDLFVPRALLQEQRSPEAATRLFRTRVVIGFSGTLALLVLVMFLSRLILEGGVTKTLWVLLATTVVLLGLPPLVRMTRSHVSGALVLFLLALVVIPVRALSTGGIHSTVSAWFTIVPVVAWLALGTRSGLVFSVACVIEAFFVAFPETIGLAASNHDAAPAVRFTVLAVLLVLTGFLAFLYDTERRSQIARLTTVLDRLEATNESLVETTARAEAAARAKSDFLASMSHELRTPLNGVMGMTQLLTASPLTAEQQTWIRTLDGSASLLLTVINDILDVSRLEAGAVELSPAPLSPVAVVRHVADLLRPRSEGKGLTLDVDLPEGLSVVVIGDDVRLEQVLINLVGNAIKFTDSGSVTIRVRSEDVGADARLRIEVVDTGIGIPADALRRIFDQFSQADASTSRRFGGTGLGLSISQRLVELMGGRIGCDSQVGEGSCFWVELRLPRTHDLPSEVAPQLPVSATTGTVLVVDDNAVNRVVAQRLLERLGHTVVLAEDGETALEYMAHHPPDMVLMDCEMPGLDGYDTTRRRRAEEGDGLPRLPIVALTAHALPEAIARCVECGMDGHIAKPIVIEELARIVGRFMESRAA